MSKLKPKHLGCFYATLCKSFCITVVSFIASVCLSAFSIDAVASNSNNASPSCGPVNFGPQECPEICARKPEDCPKGLVSCSSAEGCYCLNNLKWTVCREPGSKSTSFQVNLGPVLRENRFETMLGMCKAKAAEYKALNPNHVKLDFCTDGDTWCKKHYTLEPVLIALMALTALWLFSYFSIFKLLMNNFYKAAKDQSSKANKDRQNAAQVFSRVADIYPRSVGREMIECDVAAYKVTHVPEANQNEKKNNSQYDNNETPDHLELATWKFKQIESYVYHGRLMKPLAHWQGYDDTRFVPTFQYFRHSYLGSFAFALTVGFTLVLHMLMAFVTYDNAATLEKRSPLFHLTTYSIHFGAIFIWHVMAVNVIIWKLFEFSRIRSFTLQRVRSARDAEYVLVKTPNPKTSKSLFQETVVRKAQSEIVIKLLDFVERISANLHYQLGTDYTYELQPVVSAEASNGHHHRHFVYNGVRYMYDACLNDFHRFQVHLGSSLAEIALYAKSCIYGGGMAEAVAEFRAAYTGKNCILIMPKNFFQLAFETYWSWYAVYQISTVWIWFYFGYWKFAMIVFFSAIIAVLCKAFIALRAHKHKIALNKPGSGKETYRDFRICLSSAEDVTAGDIVIVQPGMASCDILLLNGFCRVDESSLTGEGRTVVKRPVGAPKDYASVTDQLTCKLLGCANTLDEENVNNFKEHVIFASTNVISTELMNNYQYYSPCTNPKSLGNVADKDSLCLQGFDKPFGIVLRTGANTSRGRLVQESLKRKNENPPFLDQFALVLPLILIYGIFCCIVVSVFMWDNTVVFWFLSFIVLATVVSPILPAVLTASQSQAASLLARHHNVLCNDSNRLGVAGLMGIVCFDKTGTLTKEDHEVSGFVVHPHEEIHEDAGTLPIAVRRALGCAHEVRGPDENAKHSVDRAMFAFSRYTISEDGKTLSRPINAENHFSENANAGSVDRLQYLRRLPFEHALQRMSVVVTEADKLEDISREAKSNQSHEKVKLDFEVYVKGSSESLMPQIQEMERNWLKETTKKYARKGAYVIALAQNTVSHHFDSQNFDEEFRREVAFLQRSSVESNLRLLGVLVLQNRLKMDTIEVLGQLVEGGCRNIMITGDNIDTAVCVARTTNIIAPNNNSPGETLVAVANGSDGLVWYYDPGTKRATPNILTNIDASSVKYASKESLLYIAQPVVLTPRQVDAFLRTTEPSPYQIAVTGEAWEIIYEAAKRKSELNPARAAATQDSYDIAVSTTDRNSTQDVNEASALSRTGSFESIANDQNLAETQANLPVSKPKLVPTVSNSEASLNPVEVAAAANQEESNKAIIDPLVSQEHIGNVANLTAVAEKTAEEVASIGETAAAVINVADAFQEGDEIGDDLLGYKLTSAMLLQIKVFARMTPTNKRDVVRELKQIGVTAMVGDGGNDCAALREAHVGLALGAGDASLVAPFSTPNASIKSVVALIASGRAHLATAMAVYRHLITYGLNLSFVTAIMYSYHVMLPQLVWVYIDGGITVMMSYALIMARERKGKLSSILPSSELLASPQVLSVAGIVVINIITTIVGMQLLSMQDFYKCNKFIKTGIPTEDWTRLTYNYEAGALSLIVVPQFIHSAALANLGFMHRRAWYFNYFIVALYVIFLGIWVILLIGGTPLSDLLQVNGEFKKAMDNSVMTDNKLLNPFPYVIGGLVFCNMVLTTMLYVFVHLGPSRLRRRRSKPGDHKNA